MPKQNDGANAASEAGTGKETESGGQQDLAPKPDPNLSEQAAQTSAIALLMSDHRKVEGLFAEYDSADENRKSEIISKVCAELVIHTLIEEEIFYPACREAASDEDPLDEAQVEHDSAKVLIADLMTDKGHDKYRDAKVKVLAEQIKHHVGEEEAPERGIFAKARAAGVDTADLRQRLQARKQELTARQANLEPPTAVSIQRPPRLSPQSSEESPMDRRFDEPQRDERGRFMSDDDHRGRGYGGNGDRYGSRDERSYGGRGAQGGYGDDHRGWYGDPEGHSEASRRGWAARRGEEQSFSGGRDREEDRYSAHRGGRQQPSRDDQGRFMSDHDRGRSYGHPDDDRRYGRNDTSGRERDDQGRFMRDDDRGGYGRSTHRADEDDHRYGGLGRDDGRGWYGDSRGHSEAAHRGWETRDHEGRSASRQGHDRDQDHRSGGWFGDSEGHSEASRRGWQDRR